MKSYRSYSLVFTRIGAVFSGSTISGCEVVNFTRTWDWSLSVFMVVEKDVNDLGH